MDGNGFLDRREQQPERRRRGVRNADVGPKLAARRLDKDACRHCASRVEIMLLRGNFDGARAVIAEAEKGAGRLEEMTLDTPLAQTELPTISMRALNALDDAGVVTVGQILMMPYAELVAIPQVGRAQANILVGLAREWATKFDLP